MAPFDVVFISYDEPEADLNYRKLLEKVPTAKRVHGVKGVARAWVAAANKAETSHFFSVDGDIRIEDTFRWEIPEFEGDTDQRVHVYRSRNAVNGLVYGYGSVHLFPTQLVRDFKNLDVLDFTLSVATKGFKIQPEVASTTHFNTSAYSAWKSGFREAAKLANGCNAYVGTSPDPRSRSRLEIWCSLGADVRFGMECLLGARMGALFGFANKSIEPIGDFHWFQAEYEKIKILDLRQAYIDAGETLRNEGLVACRDLSADSSSAIKRWIQST